MVRHEINQEGRVVSHWAPFVRDAALVVSLFTGFGVAVGVGRSLERFESRIGHTEERISELRTTFVEHCSLPAHYEASVVHERHDQQIEDLLRRVTRLER